MIDNQEFLTDVKKLVDSVTGDCYVGLEEEEAIADRLNSALKKLRAPVAGEAVSSIRVFVKDGKASHPASYGPRLPDGHHTFYAAPLASEKQKGE